MQSHRLALGATAVLNAIVLSVVMHGPVHAQGTLPAVQKSGVVEYLSGGVGLDESTAIKSASGQWPLSVVFSVQADGRAQFASDVKLAIHDAKGALALDVTATGPYLLARLAPGSYTLHATLDGKTLERKVQVKAGSSARVELVWPTGTNQSAS